ncbi:hypothetical protein [Microbacterium terregens]|uniref:Uncharacterized protein n=1 Tax=Microbacterium terregens TaxID=69363 RepID=A0ABV5SYM4_9MICO
MNDLLSVFDSDGTESTENRPLLMTAHQRAEIRSLFAKLGLETADLQFDFAAELTGVRIASVGELEATTAQRLIEGLHRRIHNMGRTTTGNSWDDREEDTWIDRL